MKLLQFFLLAIFITCRMNAAEIEPQSNICPHTGSSKAAELFNKCPKYTIGSIQQLKAGRWKNKKDFNASVQMTWSDKSLLLRIEVTDNKLIKTESMDRLETLGDYIKLSFKKQHVGPEKNTEILLFPDTKRTNCRIESALAPNATVKISDIKKTSYVLLVEIPHGDWESKPRHSKKMLFNFEFHDMDKKGKLRSKMTLSHNPENYIFFVDDLWATIKPIKALYLGTDVEFILSYGNFTLGTRTVSLSIFDEKGIEIKKAKELLSLPKKTFDANKKLSYSFSDLAPGKVYSVRCKYDTYFDSVSLQIRKTSVAGKDYIFFTDFTEKRTAFENRPLDLDKSKQTQDRMLELLAGQGELIWRRGYYNGSSNEFPENYRSFTSYKLELGESTKNEDIPWAVFGGLNMLDGMNEPLTLDFSTIFKGKKRLKPEIPNFKSISKEAKEKQADSHYLVLLGILHESNAAGSSPNIQIKTKKRIILQEKLKPVFNEKSKRHAYILRLWLNKDDHALIIENTGDDSTKFEIDFIAAFAGAEAKKPSGRIIVSGSEHAKQFSKLLTTSTELARQYLVDKNGLSYPSMPGGSSDKLNITDHVMLLYEFSEWGFTKEAHKLISSLPKLKKRHGDKKLELGDAILVSAIYHYWRIKRNETWLQEHWDIFVRQPLEKILQNIGSNGLGLVGGTGDFTDDTGIGSSLPLCWAVLHALSDGMEMAKLVHKTDYVNRLKKAHDRLKKNTNIKFSSGFKGKPINQSSVQFPASFGIRAEKGIRTIIEKDVYLYALNRSANVMPYVNGVRTFDTPYLLSGLGLYMDGNGYYISFDAQKRISNTLQYINKKSPLGKFRAYAQHNLMSYGESETGLWMAMAYLLSHNTKGASTLIKTFTEYHFD
ncbi:MAG: hypothetical protein HRT89_02245 [Lentisphaeria bacterium]|nr:hypothetical protein [Lentisphaeria bacterium]